jgi:hypothetical protein
MIRILREDGKLDLLKGLISIEPVSCDFGASGLTGADFKNVPYMVLKGDYTNNILASCPASIDAIKAAGGMRNLSIWTSPELGKAPTLAPLAQIT